jgi:hypothetical protein
VVAVAVLLPSGLPTSVASAASPVQHVVTPNLSVEPSSGSVGTVVTVSVSGSN